MGVLNVTSDSFSDGGRYLDRDSAIARGLELRDLGVDIVDVGGESTRPGAMRIDPEVEADRVTPVIEALAAEGIRTSVDTMRASVAEAAIDRGCDDRQRCVRRARRQRHGVGGGLRGRAVDPHALAVRPVGSSTRVGPRTTTTW